MRTQSTTSRVPAVSSLLCSALLVLAGHGVAYAGCQDSPTVVEKLSRILTETPFRGCADAVTNAVLDETQTNDRCLVAAALNSDGNLVLTSRNGKKKVWNSERIRTFSCSTNVAMLPPSADGVPGRLDLLFEDRLDYTLETKGPRGSNITTTRKIEKLAKQGELETLTTLQKMECSISISQKLILPPGRAPRQYQKSLSSSLNLTLARRSIGGETTYKNSGKLAVLLDAQRQLIPGSLRLMNSDSALTGYGSSAGKTDPNKGTTFSVSRKVDGSNDYVQNPASNNAYASAIAIYQAWRSSLSGVSLPDTCNLPAELDIATFQASLVEDSGDNGGEQHDGQDQEGSGSGDEEGDGDDSDDQQETNIDDRKRRKAEYDDNGKFIRWVETDLNDPEGIPFD